VNDFKAAVIQMNALCGKTEDNLARHTDLARRAAKRGAKLICFPELSITGHFVHEDAWRYAEPVPDGASVQFLCNLAGELDVHISAGIGERDHNVCYNTQFMVGPDGFVGKYRKSHASSDEYYYYGMGSQFPVWDIGKCKIGILICYDIMFPEVARILTLNGAEVILAPHAGRCGETESDEEKEKCANMLQFFERVGWARATDNGVYMILNNQSGNAAPHHNVSAVHAGGMVVVSPKGDVVAKSRTRSFGEEILMVDLKAQEFAEVHSRVCHPLQTRRPEVYGRLTELN
jgi:predicted amidohydrolase